MLAKLWNNLKKQRATCVQCGERYMRVNGVYFGGVERIDLCSHGCFLTYISTQSKNDEIKEFPGCQLFRADP
jgi:hypothetical protein